VNCGYWTKAIALQRLPRHLHFCFRPKPRLLCGDTRKAGPHGRQDIVAVLEKSPSCIPGQEGCITSESAVKSHAVELSPPGQIWGLGRDALGLSHLTYEMFRRICLHLLDLPPFPCAVNLICPARRVKQIFLRDCNVFFCAFLPGTSRCGFAIVISHQLCSHSSSRPMRTGVLNSSLRRASVSSSRRGPSATMRPARIRTMR